MAMGKVNVLYISNVYFYRAAQLELLFQIIVVNVIIGEGGNGGLALSVLCNYQSTIFIVDS